MIIEKLRTYLSDSKLDGLLITSEQNRRYATGFTGSSGLAIITSDRAFFLTDFRYMEQAALQCQGYEIVQQKEAMIVEIAKLVKELGIQKVGFEKDHMTYSTYSDYNEALDAEMVGFSGVVEKLRLKKSQDEIKIIKGAAQIADAAFLHILEFIRPGITELEVSNELEFFMRKQGASGSSFASIVASGKRSSLPHGVASDKVIENNDFITLDFGAYYKGYCSDITRTIALGNPDQKLIDIYHIVLEAQERGVRGIRPGITGKEADAFTRDYITSKGYGEYFGHSTGHGIGLEVHEGPVLSLKSDQVLEPGMVVTVEPGIYIPDFGGVRIEDDVLVTHEGHEVLTKSSKQLIIL